MYSKEELKNLKLEFWESFAAFCELRIYCHLDIYAEIIYYILYLYCNSSSCIYYWIKEYIQ